MLFRSKKPTFSVVIPKAVLEGVYDECDQFDVDETGGRLIGTLQHKNGHYHVQVLGLLSAGPKAQRSHTSFHQDGEYQERAFRAIEARHPEIEHIGSWHTHHVNGFPTLSGGDKDTYRRIVNHKNYNVDLFYALLVVKKNSGRAARYNVKHFIFRRSDDTFYELSDRDIRLVETTPLSADQEAESESEMTPSHAAKNRTQTNVERAKDKEFFAEFYPTLKPLLSKSSGTPYWKGRLALIDGIDADVVAMENGDEQEPSYSIATSRKDPEVADTLAEYREQRFKSARQAVVQLERDLNRALYKARKGLGR